MTLTNTPRSERRGRPTVYWRRRVIFAVVMVLTMVVGSVGWRAYQFWNHPLNPEMVGGVPANVNADAQQFTVLIVGADDRPGNPGRSDTMLLAFVDLTKRTVNLLSLPRDTFVQIPGHGWDKINAAYAKGGTPLTQKAVEGLTGIPIDFSMVVNMQGFEKIVDSVGGVDILVDENMNYDDPSDSPPLHIHLKKGMQHLDGVRALQYVRFRADNQSDWGRMKRQQTFLKALAQAAKNPSNLLQANSLLDSFRAAIGTNLTGKQLTQIALAAKDKVSDQGITGATLTGDDLWTPGGYYLAINFKEMRKTVQTLAGIAPDAQTEAKDDREASAYAAALPKGSADPSGWTGGGKSNTTPPTSGTGGTTTPGTGTGGTTKPGTGTGGTTTPGTGTGGTTKPGTGTGGTTTPGTGTGGKTTPGTGTGGTGGTTAPGTGTGGATTPGGGTGTTKPGTGTGGTTSPGTGTGGSTNPSTGGTTPPSTKP